MPTQTHRRSAGFTLTEVLVVVAVIGVLASLALPRLNFSQFKARATEEGLMVREIERNLFDYVRNNNGLPVKSGASTTINATWNPPLPQLQTGTFNAAQAGWKELQLDASKAKKASYQVTGTLTGTGGTVSVQVQTDRDADNLNRVRVRTWQLKGSGWVLSGDISSGDDQ